jgi:hypothetical protein
VSLGRELKLAAPEAAELTSRICRSRSDPP